MICLRCLNQWVFNPNEAQLDYSFLCAIRSSSRRFGFVVGKEGQSGGKMAATCVRKAFQSTSGSAKTLLTRSSSSPLTFNACKFSGIPSSRTTPRFSVQKLFPFRHPVELASLQSLMPLHSVTASALFNSLLSLHNQTWGCLSEGFGTPL